MPSTYTQGTRPMAVHTPLGDDQLLLMGFEGTEAISRLFSFRLDLSAANGTKVDFDKLLGKEIVVTMLMQNPDVQATEPKYRYFRGICRQFEQGNRDQEFTRYRAEIVPPLWFTTRVAQSRIFQQMSVPDILKKVLDGLQVEYQLNGTFEKREYCVQYRETDFNFACRLMEEEGIFYFFKHTQEEHKLVVANSAAAHPDVPGITKVQWDMDAGHDRELHHIHEWVKRQEVRSGKFAMWDHSFQRPDNNFESKKNTLSTVAVGKVPHNLQTGGNDKFEIYDYPGEFAQRFDGIDKGGGEQAGELGKITPDGTRTAELRMQAETLAGLVIEGSSNCNQFTSGHRFTLEKHFDAEGRYILTSVHHSAHGGNAYRSGDDSEFTYSNSFTCIPDALPFRPQRTTPKPCVMGAQTAIVVGPSGEEIFTDKYGRVKVQFHWDREGQADANSSCWLRVGTSWAGKQWGAISIPRIGHEVIVQFLEGDPDAPIIIGSVYNAGAMPPYKLPDEKTKSTLKSLSSKGGGGFNEFRFEDKKGEEQVFIHAQKDMDTRVLHDAKDWVGNEKHTVVVKDTFEDFQADYHLNIKGEQNQKIGETLSINAGQNIQEKAGMNMALDAGQEIHLKAGMNLVLEAGVSITLKAGGGFIVVGPAGVTISGVPVLINSGGSAGSGSGSSPTAPKAAKDAVNAIAGQITKATKAKRHKPVSYSPAALVLKQAAKNGTPFCEQCAKAAASQAGKAGAEPKASSAQGKDDGESRVGGSRSWRNNNPGNIEYGSYAKSMGATGSDGRFAVFPNYEAGRKAQEHLLFEGKNYRDLTLGGAINRWAPASENNVPAYLAAMGGERGTLMKDYTSEQRAKLLDAMQRHEGWTPGRIVGGSDAPGGRI